MKNHGAYAYSFDRDVYTGSFDTRDAALNAALERVKWLPAPITTVYTAHVTSGDPLASGHAKVVVDRMTRAARERHGDDAQGYLKVVSPKQLHELDVSLETVIKSWLARNGLGPSFNTAQNVCEHAVPLVPETPHDTSSSREVGVMGEGFDWQDGQG